MTHSSVQNSKKRGPERSRPLNPSTCRLTGPERPCIDRQVVIYEQATRPAIRLSPPTGAIPPPALGSINLNRSTRSDFLPDLFSLTTSQQNRRNNLSAVSGDFRCDMSETSFQGKRIKLNVSLSLQSGDRDRCPDPLRCRD